MIIRCRDTIVLTAIALPLLILHAGCSISPDKPATGQVPPAEAEGHVVPAQDHAMSQQAVPVSPASPIEGLAVADEHLEGGLPATAEGAIDVALSDASAEDPLPKGAALDPIVPEPFTGGAWASNGDLWERVRANFVLPPQDHPRIARELRWFLKHPEYLMRILGRAKPYLHFIVEEAEARGIPGEIVLLPVVESAFKPFAFSTGRAAGLWQFIPTTGERYGLKQNWWYDGRRDIAASTRAAFTYLGELNERFAGDWLLALASYNAGAGRVQKAIDKNRRAGKATDFWALSLPKETRTYVPRLLAIAEVVRFPEKYEIELKEIPNTAYLVSVDTGSQIDLAVVAELADLSLEELSRLNPGFNRWATDPDGPHRLLLPQDRAQSFQDRLAELPKEHRVHWRRHTIRSGETLIHIAKRYATDVLVLQQVNQLPSSRIRAGKHLLIPVVAGKSTHPVRGGAQPSGRRTVTKLRYTVQPGDTLWNIARDHGVGTQRLAQWNDMSPKDVLRPGRDLAIWREPARRAAQSPGSAAIQTIRYTVRRGDSLNGISRRFKVSLRDLRRWNASAVKGKYIHPGQKLTLHVDVTRHTL